MLGLGSWTEMDKETALGLGVLFPRTEGPFCPEVYLTHTGMREGFLEEVETK